MFVIKVHDRIVMCWNKVLPNGNYDYDDMIAIRQKHKDELGLDMSDQDIAEVINVEGIKAISFYMNSGSVDEYAMNCWRR